MDAQLYTVATRMPSNSHNAPKTDEDGGYYPPGEYMLRHDPTGFFAQAFAVYQLRAGEPCAAFTYAGGEEMLVFLPVREAGKYMVPGRCCHRHDMFADVCGCHNPNDDHLESIAQHYGLTIVGG